MQSRRQNVEEFNAPEQMHENLFVKLHTQKVRLTDLFLTILLLLKDKR